MKNIIFFMVGIALVCSAELYGKPAGPLVYIGPKDVGGASGLEFSQYQRTLKGQTLKVEHSAAELAVASFKYFGDATGGLVLGFYGSGQRAGTMDGVATVSPIKDMLGLGVGTYLKYELPLRSDLSLLPLISYDGLVERWKKDRETFEVYTRDFSFGVVAGYSVNRLVVVSLGALKSEVSGHYNYQNKDDKSSEALEGDESLSLHAGTMLQFEKFSVGLTWMNGGYNGIEISFFSTPLHQIESKTEPAG